MHKTANLNNNSTETRGAAQTNSSQSQNRNPFKTNNDTISGTGSGGDNIKSFS